MALTLVVETGGGLANANSYASLAEADAYHEAHLYASTWQTMTTPEKTAALVWATRLLDEQIAWYGYKATTVQALRWPRGGVPERDADIDAAYAALYGYILPSNVIPVWLKNATAELARQLKATDRTADVETVGYSQISVGSISLTIDKNDKKNLLPDAVVSMVEPYGCVQRASSIRTVSLLRM